MHVHFVVNLAMVPLMSATDWKHQLVGALSPVNHKELHQGRKET